MEWTNDLMLSFISEYRKYPLPWDNTHPFYKSVPKKNEAWDAIFEELGIEVPDLKRKMTSLLATHRKLRHKLGMTKSGLGADVDTAPVWFAYKAFAFLHNKYHPKTKVNIEARMFFNFYSILSASFGDYASTSTICMCNQGFHSRISKVGDRF